MRVRWLPPGSLLLLVGRIHGGPCNELHDSEGSTASCQAGDATEGVSLLALPSRTFSRQRAAPAPNEAATLGEHHIYDQPKANLPGLNLYDASKANFGGLPAMGHQRISEKMDAHRSDDSFHADVMIRLKANLAQQANRSDHEVSWFGFSGDEITGKNAPLDDDGYDVVAAMEADTEMEVFVRRLIKAMNLRIIDMGGLHGVVPYYSGTHETQSFANLLRDLKRGLKSHEHGKYGPWLARKSKKVV